MADLSDLTDKELERWLASVPCARYEPVDMKRMAREIVRHRAAKAAGATPSVHLSSDEIDQLRHHIAEHRATCAYSCSILERLIVAHGAKS